MKNFTSNAAPLLALVFLFFLSNLHGQVAQDPITNIYKVGGSSEIFIAFSTAGNQFTRQGVLDVPENLNNITKKENAQQFKFIDIRKTATATGDFNGNGADNIVTLRNNMSGGIKITIPLLGEDLIETGQKEFILDELNTMPYERLRICTGNFDDDPQDEFAICYGWTGETIRLLLFETDADLNIKLLDTYKEIAYFDYHFDITSGDTDGDGIDEIVMVKNEAAITEANTGVNPPIFISEYDLYIISYDTVTKELSKFKEAQNLKTDNTSPNYDNYGNMTINEMRVSCGDLNIDGKDEIVVGWSNYFCYHYIYHRDDWWVIPQHYHHYYRDMLFLNTFRLASQSGEIENMQNLYVTHTDFGEKATSVNQHIALSLKCKQMDNMGRDEVLVNSSTRFCVLGSTGEGMELEKKVDLAAAGGFLNIRGTEAFIVADLNPDTATMNFNKEVILLLSNTTAVHQLNNVADQASFELLMIDTVSSDTLVFLPPGPPYAMPFDDDADIEISALATGDFDLKNTDLYLIGTPQVIPVSDMQYPLVILNAPPVHFDVLDGVSHDLCDAFINDDNTSFSARYNSEVDETKTTSFDASNSMGFSSEFSAYAMAGGSGFEASVKTNWERGQSFYGAKTEGREIKEGKEVYTEDYVLYSSLDYSYYKYPVFDDAGKEIGHLAVLNPESDEFSMNWSSGNSWDHPGYIFNHEPGNILSYKSYKNNTDFCTDENGFRSHEFTKQQVANTTNAEFLFEYKDISSSGNAYSFSGGVGADLFTKIGFEGTATVNVGAFGIGGSVSTDIRAGVSMDLSSYFCSSQLCTRSTELTDAFLINGRIGRLNESYDNVARYHITPYIYRSQSGALVLDYMVDLDENNKDWWVENYGQKHDLAFILPWRYALEKGGENVKPSKLQKTSEIQFYPRIANQGDTVCITTRVHNYSLLTFDNTLKVNYYLGDPENGGVELSDIYGVKGSSKQSTMIYLSSEANTDFEEYFTFNWKVPDTLTCSPRIYAVIDQDDAYPEIHENNNTGWNKLSLYDCEACAYLEYYVDAESQIAESFHFEVYPNPARDKAMIRFALAAEENVKIEVFNLSGQKMGTVCDQHYPQGEQRIEFSVGELSNGLYFYRITAGSYFETIKMSVLK